MVGRDKVGMTAKSMETEHDEEYQKFEKLIAKRIADHDGPLFTTDVNPDALWGAYLYGMPENRRQHYNCNCCRRFIRKYGSLAAINAAAIASYSPLWTAPHGVPDFFRSSASVMADLVERAKITGVFYDDETTWGTPKTRDKAIGSFWTHLHGKGNAKPNNKTLTASQAMAEKLEDFGMLKRAIDDYRLSTIQQAITILKADVLDRSEKTIGVAEWFAKVHDMNTNQLWLAVATAPAGFAHIRSSMIATLLDEIQAGSEIEGIKKRWAEKMHPLAYRRPTAPPKAGAIVAAEKLVEKMGIERSLERRYATLNDVQSFLWNSRPERVPYTSGVFGHLKGRVGGRFPGIPVNAGSMTWHKFERDILPGVTKLEVKLDSPGNYYGLVTATHKDAPNIMQWDNTVSSYVYTSGSVPSRWSLFGEWGKVSSVFLGPWAWADREKCKNHPNQVYFSIEGCRDQANPGLALFPEIIRSEYHSMSSVIEAHSKKGRISGGIWANANGLSFTDNNPVVLRVNDTQPFSVDRVE